MNLTEEQLHIVNHSGGHARVSAVAGSGKTTTMVARLGHLLSQGVSANRMLVLMFNNSARNGFTTTMKTRLGTLDCGLPDVRTFHSLGMRLVKSFTKRGALPPYKLTTEEYVLEKLARQVAGEVYREDQESEGYLSREEVEEFLTYIDQVKSTVSSPEEVYKFLELSPRYNYFIKAYKLFEKVRKKRRIRFYGDLIHEPLLAMLGDKELEAWVSNRVDHIIVDEYQDINEAQQQLLKILAGERAEVMVVGDVDQCIYEWRGARPEYITTRFQLDFPKPENYLLSYTFRYGHQLSLAANHLISSNSRRDKKLCVSHDSTLDTTISCLEEKGVHPVLSVLDRWREEGRSLAEATVLVRLYAQSVPVELALLQAGIGYRLEGNAHVFDCSEIMALTGYLQVALGTLADEESKRCEELITAMLSQPHLGIRREEMADVVAILAEDPGNGPSLLEASLQPEMPDFIKKRFTQAATNWRWLVETSACERADKVLKQIVKKLKLYDFYHSFSTKSVTAENRIKTCEAFIGFATEHKFSVQELLAQMEGFRSGHLENSDTLLITSVHRAKGLEWPLVILPGLEEGAFPFFRDNGGGDDLEDERRLFYVALTRAIEHVVCIHPTDAGLSRCLTDFCTKAPVADKRASRFLFETKPGLSIHLGKMLSGTVERGPVKTDDCSIARRYVQAIGDNVELVEKKNSKKVNQDEQPITQTKSLEMREIGEGMRVYHGAFGAGTVTRINDRKQGRLSVLFDDHGQMILLAAYAKLQSL